MIIQCINCNKKFEVNSSLIPDVGRNIQCGSCNYTWFYQNINKTYSLDRHDKNDELITKKGPVLQTAIIAGIQAVKKTAELIPMCQPLLINGVDIDINIVDDEHIEVYCKVIIEGKTGVEMEALTGANITCLTIYDMCKSISQEMIIKEVKLLEKTGGKSDIRNS